MIKKRSKKLIILSLTVFYAVWLILVGTLIAFDTMIEKKYFEEMALLYALDKADISSEELISAFDLDESEAYIIKTSLSGEPLTEKTVSALYVILESFSDKLNAGKAARFIYNFTACNRITPTEKIGLINKFGVLEDNGYLSKIKKLRLFEVLTDIQNNLAVDSSKIKKIKSALASALTLKDWEHMLSAFAEFFDNVDLKIGRDQFLTALEMVLTMANGGTDFSQIIIADTIRAAYNLKNSFELLFYYPDEFFNWIRVYNIISESSGQSKLKSVIGCINLNTVKFIKDILSDIDYDRFCNFALDFDYLRAHNTFAKIIIEFMKLALPIYKGFDADAKRDIETFTLNALKVFYPDKVFTFNEILELSESLSAYEPRRMSSGDVAEADALLNNFLNAS